MGSRVLGCNAIKNQSLPFVRHLKTWLSRCTESHAILSVYVSFTIPRGSLGIQCSLYIDDRHTGQLLLDPRFVPTAYQNLNSPKDVSLALAKAAIFCCLFHFGISGLYFGFEKVHSCSIYSGSLSWIYFGFPFASVHSLAV